ncbi:MAG TPA: enoyl-CoA hydratase-related protein [Intrasporangium sp.]|uniref:enoyl-CoA hydratase/isomerase family protein n=1 Tax=Intrasporangium sp. TaxID=1925024 RepID=UPI002D76861E|nr:enoyl-CoA hydratase-related protein [Intrasporangium sp.]HET7398621.1 enoyl-CoA hydratase-related protein [Intrasporangium sp.]
MTESSPYPAAARAGTPARAEDTGPLPLVVQVDDGVAWVRLNRPDAMNALDDRLKGLLRDALEHLAADEAVRCVVLTGTGRAFCVGQDLKEHVRSLDDPGSSLTTTVTEHYNPIVLLLATMNKPVIAAVNGVAAGAGMSFALACDFRVAAETAAFNTAFAGIALSCDSGSSWTLPRLVGPARAKELLLLPRTLPASEALSLGLVTRVVPPDALEATVSDLAAQLAAGPTVAYGSIRRAVAYSAGHDLAAALAHEGELMGVTGATQDHRAAVDAFLAKAKPSYSGR